MMPSAHVVPAVRVALLLSLCAACGAPSQQSQESQIDQDRAEYDALAAQLEQRRAPALSKKATELFAQRNQLYWLEFPTFAPTLHRLDDATGVKYHYGFSIASGSDYNFRASDELIVTVQRDGDKNVLKAYRPDAQNAEVAHATVDGPHDGQKWWAYAVDGVSVYFLRTGPAELWRWRPFTGTAPERLFDLTSTGLSVGELWDFAVEGDRMLLVESGRLWQVDLAARRATWLHHQTEVSGTVWFDDAGILYTAATGPFYHRFSDGQTLDLAQVIADATYRLNETYQLAHRYAQDAALAKDRVVYVGQSGVFSLSLGTGQVAPVLLTPHLEGLRVEYRRPTPVASGALYVVGLESTSGSVGAEGPVYRVAP